MPKESNATEEFKKGIRRGRVGTGDMDVQVGGKFPTLSAAEIRKTRKAFDNKIAEFEQPGAAPNAVIDCRDD